MNSKKYFFLSLILFLFLSTEYCWSHTVSYSDYHVVIDTPPPPPISNEPPVLTAVGDQLYCPGENIKIVTDLTITDPDDTGIEAVYVQISEGYIKNQDLLSLTGHPNIKTTWNSTTAKLELLGISGGEVLYSDFVTAIKDIEFSTTNMLATGDRSFSITVGDANYLPSTGHFYEFVASEGIAWTDAKIAAENRTYFGLEGYLVTIMSDEEAKLTGEQAPGTGWIGGSDSETEGVWKWMTGPEAGTIFWNGDWNGSTPNFAFWNNNPAEPNNANNEDYAHITHPDLPGANPGSWNDLSNTGGPDFYVPKGYLVEYGGMPNDPILNISASTSIHIPEITNTVSDSRCGVGILTLEATSDLGTINWYDAQIGGNLIATGTNYTTPSITNTTTYYVAAAIDAVCTGGVRTPVTATIDVIPFIDETSGSIICFSGIGDIYATSSLGSIVRWYDTPTGGTLLGTGNAFTTQNINSTTFYYAEASTPYCVSTVRVPVEVTVNTPTKPTGDAIQFFCDKDNSTISELSTNTGTNITWYNALIGGNIYNNTEALIDGQKYYASQNDGICESQDRLEVLVTIYNSVVALPSASIPKMVECDTDNDGNDTNNFTNFDLRNHESILINGEQLSGFTFTYFLDASYSNLISSPTSFENTIVKTQIIYVRITNNSDVACFTDTSFEIEVLELPITNPPAKYSQCDDSSNDGQALFNLTLNSIKEEINPNYISEGLTFTYFETQIDAETNNAIIPNPESYVDSPGFNPETIWVRIENPNGCYRFETIELEVTPSSGDLASYNPQLFQCDDGTDLRDGISTFDLTIIQTHIESVIFSGLNITVQFYESLTDAELENNQMIDIANHQNTNSPNNQNIWVRVKSDIGNNCLGLEDFPNLLNVEALPIAFAPPTLIECDDNQDGVFVFDTSNVESTILNTQSLANISISYFDSTWNPLLDYNGTPINSPFPNSFETTSQTIYYTLTNRNTNDLDGACFESNFLEFIVDVLPINNTVIIPPICDPDPEDGVLIGTFDTSSLESNIGAQPDMDIAYFDAVMNPLVDADGNTITSPFPSSFNSGTQTINVVVTNPINTVCSITNTIDFVVNALPEFTVEESRIICESGANSTITLDVIQDNSSEVLDYEWTDENGAFISNDQSIDITSSGIYTITLFKTNGTGCPRSREIIAIYSEKANLEYDDITIVDDSNNNSIAINNDNQNLGKGDYEFSLDEFGPYQDEPIFNNLLPGIYTLYARDKNACGTSEIEVSVVGFPKFFSPNNDGKNDKWQVLGINENFYSSSTIHIYDRFGKIIATVDPLSEGWNGYYNGAILPSDDYWFSTVLTDNDGNERIRKGHFSLIRR